MPSSAGGRPHAQPQLIKTRAPANTSITPIDFMTVEIFDYEENFPAKRITGG
jgi:hypothetical protein